MNSKRWQLSRSFADTGKLLNEPNVRLRFVFLFSLVGLITQSAKSLELNKAKLFAKGTAAVVCGIAGRVLYNYAELRSIQMKGRADHLLFGDQGEKNKLKVCNWKRAQWPTARTIMENREAFKRELCSAIVNKEIIIFDQEGNVIEQPTWDHVVQLIELEKAELHKDLVFLEEKHIVYYRFVPFVDPFGFLKDFKSICLSEGIDPYGVASLTAEQEARLEKRVKAICCRKSWHFFRPNYGKATRVYWRAFKLHLRLSVMKQILDDMRAGYDQVHLYDPTQAPVQTQVFSNQANVFVG